MTSWRRRFTSHSVDISPPSWRGLCGKETNGPTGGGVCMKHALPRFWKWKGSNSGSSKKKGLLFSILKNYSENCWSSELCRVLKEKSSNYWLRCGDHWHKTRLVVERGYIGMSLSTIALYDGNYLLLNAGIQPYTILSHTLWNGLIKELNNYI